MLLAPYFRYKTIDYEYSFRAVFVLVEIKELDSHNCSCVQCSILSIQ